jgi:hypothetical protein
MLEMHYKAMIERDGSSTLKRLMGGDQKEEFEGRRAGCWNSIHKLVNSQLWECGRGIFNIEL